jgi:hypothetical protein
VAASPALVSVTVASTELVRPASGIVTGAGVTSGCGLSSANRTKPCDVVGPCEPSHSTIQLADRLVTVSPSYCTSSTVRLPDFTGATWFWKVRHTLPMLPTDAVRSAATSYVVPLAKC